MTLNVAVVLFEPTVTDAGVVRSDESSESVTVAPPFCDTVTVQVELAPDPRLAGAQDRPVNTVRGAVSEIVAVCVLPFNVAVTVTV